MVASGTFSPRALASLSSDSLSSLRSSWEMSSDCRDTPRVTSSGGSGSLLTYCVSGSTVSISNAL